MFITKLEPSIDVAVSEATVFQVQGSSAQDKIVKIWNLDTVNTLTYKVQYSDDNTTWTDVAAFTTLAPGAWIILTAEDHVFHRLRGYGNLVIAAEVSQMAAFVDTFSFVSL